VVKLRRGQDRVYRIDRGGRAIAPPRRRATSGYRLELGGKSRSSSLKADSKHREGLVDGICSIRAKCVARAPPADAGEHRRNSDREDSGSYEHPAHRCALDKGLTSGAIVAKVQLTAIRKLVEQGVPMARHAGSRKLRYGARVLLSADTAEQRTPTSIVAQQEIFGRTGGDDFRTPAEAVEWANNTVYGLAACVGAKALTSLCTSPRRSRRRGLV